MICVAEIFYLLILTVMYQVLFVGVGVVTYVLNHVAVAIVKMFCVNLFCNNDKILVKIHVLSDLDAYTSMR